MTEAAAPLDACCPRCGTAFHCGVNDADPCPCTTLKIDGQTLARLNAQYRGCLCLRCLQALSGAADGSTRTASD